MPTSKLVIKYTQCFFEEFKRFLIDNREIKLENVQHLSPNRIGMAVEAMEHEGGFDSLDQQWIYFTDDTFSKPLVVTLEDVDDTGPFPQPVTVMPSCTYNFTYTPRWFEEPAGNFFLYPHIYPVMTSRNGRAIDTGVPEEMIFTSVEDALKHYRESAKRLRQHPWMGITDIADIEKYLK